jgi:hypothetical protein
MMPERFVTPQELYVYSICEEVQYRPVFFSYIFVHVFGRQMFSIAVANMPSLSFQTIPLEQSRTHFAKFLTVVLLWIFREEKLLEESY